MSKSGEIADALIERLRIQGQPAIEAEFRAYIDERDRETALLLVDKAVAAAEALVAAQPDVLAKDGGVSLDNPIAISPT